MYSITKEAPRVLAVQLVELQSPVTSTGFGLGCWPLQPDPAIDADKVPLIEVEVTVPDVEAVIAQLLHVSRGKLIENVPALDTVAVPAPLALQVPGPGCGNGISSVTV